MPSFSKPLVGKGKGTAKKKTVDRKAEDVLGKEAKGRVRKPGKKAVKKKKENSGPEQPDLLKVPVTPIGKAGEVYLAAKVKKDKIVEEFAAAEDKLLNLFKKETSDKLRVGKVVLKVKKTPEKESISILK